MNDRNNLPIVLSVPELAHALQIGRNAAYDLVRSGQIRCVRIGKTIRIPQSALMDYLNRTDTWEALNKSGYGV